MLKLAVAGVGNNISALLQGIEFYKQLYQADTNTALPGIKHLEIGKYKVFDIDFVAAFDVNKNKIGKTLNKAIFIQPNNYPQLNVKLPTSKVKVSAGSLLDGLSPSLLEICHPHALEVTESEITKALVESKADVLFYSLPTGAPNAAEFYAKCALNAGVAFVNCTPEKVARNPDILKSYIEKGLPLLGDDLASHMGSSIVHRTLLKLFLDRGVTLKDSYQVNLGGNADFINLRERGHSKVSTKKSALSLGDVDLSFVEVIPSGGYIKCLNDCKIGIIHVDGLGWGGTPVEVDLKLKVQDSSNAAGIIIDLIRIAGAMKDMKLGGFPDGAGYLLKSNPTNHEVSEKYLNELIKGLGTNECHK